MIPELSSAMTKSRWGGEAVYRAKKAAGAKAQLRKPRVADDWQDNSSSSWLCEVVGEAGREGTAVTQE